MWLDIYDKKPIWNGYNPITGRFFPLASIDLNILMQISSSPYLFFMFNALIALIFACVNIKMLNLINSNSALNGLLVALLMLSVGFVVVIFSICYPERILVLALSIFILCSFYIINNPTKTTFIVGIVALNISIYLKEPIFISTFAFGFFLFLSALKNHNTYLRLYSISIGLSSVVYALLYIVLIFGKIEKTYDRYTENTDILMIKIQGFANYILNDGIIIFLLSGILLYRIYRILIKKDKILAFFDGLLIAGFLYLCVFLFLGIFETYYLLPCYIFSGGSIVYFLIQKQYIKNIFIKICFIVGVFGFCVTSLPSGIYNIINLKSIGVQFNDTLKFSAKYLSENPNTNIYFDGTGRGREIYAEYYVGYFIEYLNKIYHIDKFDILVDSPNGKDIFLDTKSPYTYKNSLSLSTPKSGDLIILNNTSTKVANSEYINSLLEKHTLLYKTSLPTIPYINIKSLIKYTNERFFKADIRIFGHPNVFRLPLDTYVFVLN